MANYTIQQLEEGLTKATDANDAAAVEDLTGRINNRYQTGLTAAQNDGNDAAVADIQTRWGTFKGMRAHGPVTVTGDTPQSDGMRAHGPVTVTGDAPQSTDDELQVLDQISSMNQPPSTRVAPSTEPEPETTVGGLARAVGAGVARIPFDMMDLPSNLYNLGAMGLGKVFDFDPAYAAHLSNMPGLKQLKERGASLPEGATPLEKAAFHGSQWAQGSGKALKEGANVLSNTLRAVDVKTPVSAAAGSYVGEQLGGETGGVVGELFAGITNPTKAVMNQAEKAYAKVKDVVTGGDSTRALVEGRNIDDVLTIIANHATYPETAMQKLADGLEAGNRAPLDELLDDPGIADLLKIRTNANNRLRDTVDRMVEARETQVIEQLNALSGGPADPAELKRLGQKHLNEGQARVTARTDEQLAALAPAEQAAKDAQTAQVRALETNTQQARQGLEQAKAQAGTDVKPAQAAREVAGAFTTLKDELKAVAKVKWQKPDASGPMDATELQADLAALLDKLDPALGRAVTRKYGTQLKEIDMLEGKGTKANPQAIQTTLSELKGKLQEARQSGNYSSAEKAVEDLRLVMDDFLNTAPGLGRKQAVAASKEMFDRTGKGGLPKAYLDDPEKFVRNLGGWKGEDGVVLAQRINEANDPRVTAAAETSLRSAMRDKLDDPGKLRDDGQYGEVLESFPQLDAQVVDLIASKQELELAEKALKAGTKGAAKEYKAAQKAFAARKATVNADSKLKSAAIKNSDLGKFIAAPDTVMNKIIGKGKFDLATQQKLKALHRASVKYGGESLFKSQLITSVMAQVAPPKYRARRLVSASVDKFRAMRPTLEESGALSKAELDEIDTQLSKGADATKLRADAKVEAGGLIARTAPELANLLASVGALAGSKLIGSASSLMINGAMRRYALRAVKNADAKSDPAKLQLLDDYLSDPQKFADDMERVSPDLFKRLTDGDEVGDDKTLTQIFNAWNKWSQVLPDEVAAEPEEEEE